MLCVCAFFLDLAALRFFLFVAFAKKKKNMIIVHELDELSAWHICMCMEREPLNRQPFFSWQTMQNEMKEKNKSQIH